MRLVNVRRAVWFVVLLLALATSGYSAEVLSWQEEAVQSNGSILLVERTMSMFGNHEVAAPLPIGEQSIRFVLPGSQTPVEWKDAFSPEVGMANFLPMLVEARKDTAYIVAYPMTCPSYNKWGRPNPAYVVFRYDRGKWVQIPLAELPPEIKTPNLVSSSPDDEGRRVHGGVITAEAIAQLRRSYWREDFKQLLRNPIAQPLGGGSCMEMVRTGKFAWRSVLPFGRQPDRASCERMCVTEEVLPGWCPCKKLFPSEPTQ